jgi:hypothetical protein
MPNSHHCNSRLAIRVSVLCERDSIHGSGAGRVTSKPTVLLLFGGDSRGREAAVGRLHISDVLTQAINLSGLDLIAPHPSQSAGNKSCNGKALANNAFLAVFPSPTTSTGARS